MEQENRKWPRLDTLAFESHHQYMATLHEAFGTGSPVAYVKGSVEAVVERCTSVLVSEGLQLLFTYVPFMNTAFHSAPIRFTSRVHILVVGFVVMATVGMEKRIVRRPERPAVR